MSIRLNRRRDRLRKKSALITGASAGLGEEFADQLVKLGVTHLVITARRQDRLSLIQVALMHSADPALEVETVVADLSQEAGVTGLMAELDRRGFKPDILINNAGFGDLGTFESSDPAKMEQMIAVNITALTRLTQWALPAMLAKKTGWICNVGSTAGLIALPTFAVYAATKAYVNSFTEALRIELHGSGVEVLALCPGPVETEFGKVASRENSKRKFAPPDFPLRKQTGGRERNAVAPARRRPADSGHPGTHPDAAGRKHAALDFAPRFQSHQRRLPQGTGRAGG